MPKGFATAELQPDTEAAHAVTALHGQDFGGRPVRIERNDISEKRRKSGGLSSYGGGEGRYFINTIGCKCPLCGQVGHKGDCGVEPVVPCHLCARCDHDPGAQNSIAISTQLHATPASYRLIRLICFSIVFRQFFFEIDEQLTVRTSFASAAAGLVTHRRNAPSTATTDRCSAPTAGRAPTT